MKPILFIYSLNFIIFFSGNLFSQNSAAVYPFSYSGITSQEARQVTESFRSNLKSLNKFSLLNRTSMESLLYDQGINIDDPCNDQACAIAIGQLLAIDDLITGNIARIDKNFIINIKIINISSGSISKDISENYKGDYKDLFDIMLPVLAHKLVNENSVSDNVIRKKKRPMIPITLITVGTAAIAVPVILYLKNHSDNDPEKRELQVQW